MASFIYNNLNFSHSSYAAKRVLRLLDREAITCFPGFINIICPVASQFASYLIKQKYVVFALKLILRSAEYFHFMYIDLI